MWQGKKKAVTFSFDDGVTQDIRLIEILNKYGLKGTFNLSAALMGLPRELDVRGVKVRHDKISPSLVKSVYAEHEVAAHGLTHPYLTRLDDETLVYQVEEDRRLLERLCGEPVVGMAYPFGDVDERVVTLLQERTGIRYCRTVTSTHTFIKQTEDLLRYNPTVYYIEEGFEKLVDEFLEGEEGLLYIWGHSYEMDAGLITWEKFEEICKKLAGRGDIFYGTNKEVLL